MTSRLSESEQQQRGVGERKRTVGGAKLAKFGSQFVEFDAEYFYFPREAAALVEAITGTKPRPGRASKIKIAKAACTRLPEALAVLAALYNASAPINMETVRALTALGIGEPVRSQLARDEWVTVSRIDSIRTQLARENRYNSGLLITMLRNHEEPTSQDDVDRFRTASGWEEIIS